MAYTDNAEMIQLGDTLQLNARGIWDGTVRTINYKKLARDATDPGNDDALHAILKIISHVWRTHEYYTRISPSLDREVLDNQVLKLEYHIFDPLTTLAEKAAALRGVDISRSDIPNRFNDAQGEVCEMAMYKYAPNNLQNDTMPPTIKQASIRPPSRA